MRKCRGCKRETKDDHETVCTECGWLTDAVPDAPLVAGDKRVNSSRHREQPTQRE